MMRASEKLRAQKSLCKKVRVSIRTGMFNPEEAKYANGVLIDLPYPTDDVRLLTKAAVDALDRVFRSGFKYSRAEVLLMNLCQQGVRRRPFCYLPASRRYEGDGSIGPNQRTVG